MKEGNGKNETIQMQRGEKEEKRKRKRGGDCSNGKRNGRMEEEKKNGERSEEMQRKIARHENDGEKRKVEE